MHSRLAYSELLVGGWGRGGRRGGGGGRGGGGVGGERRL